MVPVNCALKDGTCCLIRTAEEGDAGALVALAEETAREYRFTVQAPDEVERDLESRRGKIREFGARANWLMLVACSGAEVIGGVSFRGGTTRRTQHHGMLGVAVAERWRGRGVARRLIERMLEWASAHPVVEKVGLCVFAEHGAAISLYRSLGFVEEGRRVREIRFSDGRYGDDLLMARFVKPAGGVPPGAPERAASFCVRGRSGAR